MQCATPLYGLVSIIPCFFSVALHIRQASYEVFEEIVLLLRLNALLPAHEGEANYQPRQHTWLHWWVIHHRMNDKRNFLKILQR